MLHLWVAIWASALALIGAGLGWAGRSSEAQWAWGLAMAPSAATLAAAIARSLLGGRIGVDAIALLAMSAALALGQTLAGAVIAIMWSGGQVLEAYAQGKAERHLRALRDRSPQTANRIVGADITAVPVGHIACGDLLLVRAGEILPVDGDLCDAAATIDEAALTGEPLPVRKETGAALKSGTVNAGESFRYRASATAERSAYAGIVRMVETARTAKAPFIRLADRLALLLLPVSVLTAGLAWLSSGDPERALAVLVVATPCPLILAAPVAFVGGIAKAARAGILIKGGAIIEGLAAVRSAAFDKTGTLTTGGAELLTILTSGRVEPDEALRLAASLEQASHNVLAQSIIRAATRKSLVLSAPVAVREHRGSGIEGRVDGWDVMVGSRDLVTGTAPLPDWAGPGPKSDGDGTLSVHVALDGHLVAVIVLSDVLRPDALGALASLRALGVTRLLLVTGDRGAGAEAAARSLPLDAAWTGCSPERKLAIVRQEQARQPLMMVGDGINDAPALAAADVGVAMGARGATASSEAADVVVIPDDIAPVAAAVAIARRTRAIALQSVGIGLSLSGVAMVLAALGQIPPVAGALLQEVIDVAVIINALRASGGPAPASYAAVPDAAG